MKKIIIYFVGLIFLILFFAYMHELVHVEIFESYGIESEIKLFYPGKSGFVTIGEIPCPSDFCELAHDINDIIGYHLLAIISVVGLFGGIFLFLKKWN